LKSFEFPDPAEDFEQGVVAVGGDLQLETLKSAYSKGIFPWPHEGYPMLWFCPDPRGVLMFEEFRIPRSFQKTLRKFQDLTITRNGDFERVIQECAHQKRKDQKGSWINSSMIKAYLHLHQQGYAHSWEVWKSGQIVGGGYGVLFHGVFSGESLFHRETNMSKFALVNMVRDLKNDCLTWMDTQMVTPLLKSFGAKEISKKDYLAMLKARQKKFNRD